MISWWFYRKLNSSFRFLAFRIFLLCVMAVEEIIGSNLVIANLTILRVVGFVCVKFNVSIVEQKNSFEKDIPRIQRLNFLICIIELSTVFRFDRYVWIVLAFSLFDSMVNQQIIFRDDDYVRCELKWCTFLYNICTIL